MINPSDVLRNSASAMSIASSAMQLREASTNINTTAPKQKREVLDIHMKPLWFAYKDIIVIDLNTVYSVRAIDGKVRFSLRKDGNVETIRLSDYDRQMLMQAVTQKLCSQGETKCF